MIHGRQHSAEKSYEKNARQCTQIHRIHAVTNSFKSSTKNKLRHPGKYYEIKHYQDIRQVYLNDDF